MLLRVLTAKTGERVGQYGIMQPSYMGDELHWTVAC